MRFMLLVFVFLSGYNLKACSCVEDIIVFCERIVEGNYIVLAEVVVASEFHKDYSKIRVIENLYNQIDESEIDIYENDNICAEPVPGGVGDTVLLKLGYWEAVDINTGKDYGWVLSSCTVWSLKYSNGIVRGRIYEDAIIEQDYEDFKIGLKECIATSLSSNEVGFDDLKVYPNPVADILYVDQADASAEIVRVIGLEGKEHKVEVKKTDIRWEVHLADLSSGVYFIILDTPKGIARKRFVKL